MNALRWVGVVAVSSAAALAIAWASEAPVSMGGPSEALVRLSWRIQGVSVEECRRLSEEELERVAPHMRRPEVCVGGIADYELRVELDAGETLVDTVRPSGVRRDRPVYVFRDLGIAPGTSEVSVRFRALVPDDFDPEGRPITFAWEGTLSLGEGEIALITLDEAGARLVRRTQAGDVVNGAQAPPAQTTGSRDDP